MLALREYLTKPRRGRLALYGGLGAVYGPMELQIGDRLTDRIGLRPAWRTRDSTFS
jgi:hypothetical protein